MSTLKSMRRRPLTYLLPKLLRWGKIIQCEKYNYIFSTSTTLFVKDNVYQWNWLTSLKSNFTETIVLTTMRPIIQVPQVSLYRKCAKVPRHCLDGCCYVIKTLPCWMQLIFHNCRVGASIWTSPAAMNGRVFADPAVSCYSCSSCTHN